MKLAYTLVAIIAVLFAKHATAQEHALEGSWKVLKAGQIGGGTTPWIMQTDKIVVNTIGATAELKVTDMAGNEKYKCTVPDLKGWAAQCTLEEVADPTCQFPITVAPLESQYCQDLKAKRAWSELWPCTKTPVETKERHGPVSDYRSYIYGHSLPACFPSDRGVVADDMIARQVLETTDVIRLGSDRGVCFAYDGPVSSMVCGPPGDGAGTGGND